MKKETPPGKGTGCVLGVDVGSVAVSIVETAYTKEILHIHYSFHHGDIRGTLRRMLKGVKTNRVEAVACTTASSYLLKDAVSFDPRIAAITAAKAQQPDVRSLLSVGGEQFSLITFDADGKYRDLKTNTSCAAGTGSFLDQQARRLNLSGSAELSEKALQNTGTPPIIASRCSVFAGTDIVHAQQVGYSMEEICDGICRGLADNIADILLSETDTPSPIVFHGGVSLNQAVVNRLEQRIGQPLLTDHYSHVYGAMGAGLLYLTENHAVRHAQQHARQHARHALTGQQIKKAADYLETSTEQENERFYEPLSLNLSQYPDFDGDEHYLYTSEHTGPANPVETDIYRPFQAGETYAVFLGFDIGSTSTKAVLLSDEKEVSAGFYTRTAGRPLNAVQAILETIDELTTRKKIVFHFKGFGTTGAGRKFTGEIIGADLILDEISAHARAAFELNPKTDTIIEIGGQDAKFTTLRNGLVTFSQMNTVCAAGTGTFIEEQAKKLDVPLSEFSRRAEGRHAPLVSDRCTVFMERDINRFLNNNYPVDHMLAATLFAVRENYILKVATEAAIGDHVCFQGATAKNKALVAAFEQKLEKPIYVSKYCHLTGALGAALMVADETPQTTSFKGPGIHKEKIPIRTENCTLCNNHCRIRVASVQNEETAYGFLCGRDYQTQRYMDKNTSGFDLLKARARVFKIDPAAPGAATNPPSVDTDPVADKKNFTIGLPAALHLFDDLPFWKYFFKELGVPVITSEGFTGGVQLGKKSAGAEFCAPMNALHGHARYLSQKTDALFLPIYLEDWQDPGPNNNEHLRQYCYYTQLSSSLVGALEQNEQRTPCLLPLVGYRKNSLMTKFELSRTLDTVLPENVSFLDISRAYDRAVAFTRESKEKLVELYRESEPAAGDIRVVFLGRPYTVLDPGMNKGIPGIFAALGVRTYFQDMLPLKDERETAIQPLLKACHWKYASRILEAAESAAKTDGLYPVLVTSFRCAPDSFIIQYFKRILDAAGKPYLILQLDEHDSNVGYETRIEAGVRAFRNHEDTIPRDTVPLRDTVRHLPVNPEVVEDLTGKILLYPHWDGITAPLLIANLQRAGIDARLLEEDESVVRESMRTNTGQCIPINTMILEFIRYVKKYHLDPARTVLWTIKSGWSCNLGMYPSYIKSMLEAHGGGMEKAGVYAGEITHIEMSPVVAFHTYFAFLFGGLIRKLGCRIRPYEKTAGETDRAITKAIDIFTNTFLGHNSYLEAVQEALALFKAIEHERTQRPKVAIFGDLYMRDNAVMNQDLIHFIEDAGGEVITTPFNEYAKIISSACFKRWFKERKFMALLQFKPLLAAVEFLEKRYFNHFKDLLDAPVSSDNPEAVSILSSFNLRLEHTGESWENLLKIFHILREHPDVSLFVQTNPAFCCPSLLTEAMSKDIERVTGVPIVTLTYDGTGTPINNRLIPYLHHAARGPSC